MTATLTDRYIAATVKSLPPQLQAEVRDELQASIADAIEARAEQGESPQDIERAVLTDLGDPGVLAAGYADRPLHLLGPKYYLTWWRLLKLLVAIVPACAFGGVAIAEALNGATVGGIIGEGLAVALAVTVHLAFWTTLVFVILERTGADTGGRWSVDQLPEDQHPGTGRADLIASLVLVGVYAGLLVWDQLRGFVPGDAPLPLLNPDLWPWGIGVVVVLLGAEAALAIVVHARGHWTSALAWINTALAVGFVSLALTALGRGVLFNPEFVEVVFIGNGVDSDARTVLAVLTGIGVAGIGAWDAIDGWLKARRTRLIG